MPKSPKYPRRIQGRKSLGGEDYASSDEDDQRDSVGYSSSGLSSFLDSSAGGDYSSLSPDPDDSRTSFHDRSLQSQSPSSLYPSLEKKGRKVNSEKKGDRSLSYSPESAQSGRRDMRLRSKLTSSPRTDEGGKLYPQHLLDREKSTLESTSRERGGCYPNLKTMNERQSEEKSSDVNPLPLLVILFILLVICVYWMWGPTSPAPGVHTDPALSPYENFVNQVSSLKESLPGQHRRLWSTVQASARHILGEDHSDYPAVILMAHHTADAGLASCLVTKIASAYETSLGLMPPSSFVDMNQLQTLDAAQQKEKLDEALHSAFSTNKRKSFIIHNLQSLQPEAALLLHGYCDNDNAPYKDVMLILALQMDEKTSSLDPDNPNMAENYLEKLWSRGLDMDKLTAVLSRVGNNIAVVTHEDQNATDKVCG